MHSIVCFSHFVFKCQKQVSFCCDFLELIFLIMPNGVNRISFISRLPSLHRGSIPYDRSVLLHYSIISMFVFILWFYFSRFQRGFFKSFIVSCTIELLYDKKWICVYILCSDFHSFIFFLLFSSIFFTDILIFLSHLISSVQNKLVFIMWL